MGFRRRSPEFGRARLAENGCDDFTLARFAGHSAITITQPYRHFQACAVERASAVSVILREG